MGSTDFPLRKEDLAGIRSQLERKCGNPTIAEDLLSEAIETSLVKLREGKIERPEQLIGYVYRVALNHLRNFRRRDKAPMSSAEPLEMLEDERTSDVAAPIDHARWAQVVMEVLKELPAARDRELLVSFYLGEEDKDSLCKRLDLDETHFNRVIHRARERFRALLEGHGLQRSDFLSVALLLVG
ncbi:MAG TPA: sigma-70 family RNA polymerase sigma factor [Steroidobacteraceae bacterium]|nr:sigma-70 family RNA polymerase sigma factor [Steroidobacteraceae bacterium]